MDSVAQRPFAPKVASISLYFHVRKLLICTLSPFAKSFKQGTQARHLRSHTSRHRYQAVRGGRSDRVILVSYIFGGFSGDQHLGRRINCPMGWAPRFVLFVLFLACAEFAQVNGSDVSFLVDNYCMSPLLLLCLAATRSSDLEQ